MARALELSLDEMPGETERLTTLRDRLFEGLQQEVTGLSLNGPDLAQRDLRLAGNLNVNFDRVDGEALLMSIPNLSLSTGAACSSADPEPSHVLRELGLSEDRVRGSLRFGLGRFNTEEEVEAVIAWVAEAVERLRKMGSP